MVGDPCQLPATVFSRVAKDANYGQSLFQVRAMTDNSYHLLNHQGAFIYNDNRLQSESHLKRLVLYLFTVM